MDIYPIHLRKKRIDYNKSSFNVDEMVKIKVGFEELLKDLDHLKQHLNYMEKKYKTKDAEI